MIAIDLYLESEMQFKARYSLIVVFLLTLNFQSCKHKEQEVKVSKKTNAPVKKNMPAATKQTNQGSKSDEWYEALGLTRKQVKSSELYSFIDDWYGTPYKYSGCSKSGVDCSCFTTICYEKVYGKKVSRTANDLFLNSDQIQISRAKEGDLVFFKMGGNKISHVGIYLKKNYFVHSSTSQGVVVNSLDEAYYKKYFFCAGKAKSS